MAKAYATVALNVRPNHVCRRPVLLPQLDLSRPLPALVLRRLGGDGRRLTHAEDWPAVPEPSAENCIVDPENWTTR